MKDVLGMRKSIFKSGSPFIVFFFSVLCIMPTFASATPEGWINEKLEKENYFLYGAHLAECTPMCRIIVNLDLPPRVHFSPPQKQYSGVQLLGKETSKDHIKGVVTLFGLTDFSEISPWYNARTPDEAYQRSLSNPYTTGLFVSGLTVIGLAYNPDYFNPYKEEEITYKFLYTPPAKFIRTHELPKSLKFYNLKTFEDKSEQLRHSFKEKESRSVKEEAL